MQRLWTAHILALCSLVAACGVFEASIAPKPEPMKVAPSSKVDTRPVHERCGVWTAELTPPTPGDAALPQGVSAGGVRSRSAILWTRTDTPTAVHALYSPGPKCPEIKTDAITTTADGGQTAHFPLTDLAPGTLYRYRLEVEGGAGPSAPGWFRTAPEADVPVRLAFSADLSRRKSMHRMLGDVIAATPDMFLFMGDWPYADLDKPAMTLDDYRAKHIRSRKGPKVREWTRAMAIHSVWDDHEVFNDWDASDKSREPERVAAGLRTWHEYFPIAGADPGEIYRRYMWGPQIEIFQLDCRSHRTANKAPDDASKTMLGTKQRDWLLAGLKDSTAAFKLIVTSVPLDFGTTGRDHWKGFLHERQQIFDHIAEESIGGVIFLSGDQHWFSVHHLPEGFKEFQVGPVGHSTRLPPRGKPPWVIKRIPALNFGTIDYWPGPSPVLLFSFWSERQVLLYQETVRAGVGKIIVKARSPGQRWRITGAHRFVGQGNRQIDWATPGTYKITRPGRLPVTKTLRDGGELVFEFP